MSVIQELPESDYPAFVTLTVNAYPSLPAGSEDEHQRLVQRFLMRRADPTNHFYGLYREDRLVGGMILYDFTIRLLSTCMQAGGVGSVGVDLLHKKEKIAKELVDYFVRYYRDRGALLALLYPFRPDFYRNMGFGYGSKVHQYRVRPADLPKGAGKVHVVFLEAADKELLRGCYDRCLAVSNGLIEKSQAELDRMFASFETRVVGYKRDGVIRGYASFTFKSYKPDNLLANDVHVKEMLYEDREALAGLLAFFHSQADQINRIVFTTHDEYFHFLLRDPRNGTENLLPSVYHETNVQGVGLMYRVLDVPGIFRALAAHNFGGQTCRVKLDIADSFLAENAGATILHVKDGFAQVQPKGDYDVELRMDIAEFSSLLVGGVDLKSLVCYGLAEVSDSGFLDTLNRLFAVELKPICTTAF